MEIGSKLVATSAIRMAITSSRQDETNLKQQLMEDYAKSCGR